MKFLSPDQYQPIADTTFLEIKNAILCVLPNARIEHIGSSSVPGLLSKGDLDVFVGVPRDSFDTAISALQSLGFTIKENTLRTDELCPFESHDYSIDVGIQLVANDSEFEFFLEFRRMLLESDDLRKRYNELKLSSAHLSHCDYRSRKSQFIEQLLGKLK